MIIHCRLCKCAIKSIGPPGDMEIARTMELMAKHLTMKHRTQAMRLQGEVGLLTTYLMLKYFVDVPPTETVLLSAFEEAAGAVTRLFAEEAKPVA